MSMTDPIADFLTRIRNAIHASHETVLMPASRQKAELARILAEQGYIDAYSVAAATDAPGEVLEIRLRYDDSRRSAISGLRRVSRPGRRAYVDATRRLAGEEVPMTIPGEKKHLLSRFFGRRAA